MTSEPSAAYPVRRAFRKFFPPYLEAHPGLAPEKRRAAECIMKCKTGELGYNVDVCEKCGHTVIHAVSCNNRSCPCCQAPLEKKWEMERNTEVIAGIAYYHVVFTVPHELNALIKANAVLLLGLMFKCVHSTLLSLCADRRFMGAKPGILSVLHTWGQRLSFHPHIHVCISGGGLTPAGKFVETAHKGFFLPEAAIAASFRGRFLCALKLLYDSGKLDMSLTRELESPDAWQEFIDAMFRKQWLPFVKETFNGKGNAVKYLARYSFRTAIANSRIVSVDSGHVTFRYKDYSDGSKEKTLTVSGESFVAMFLQHVLPPRFHRMRSAGYLANCTKVKNLRLIHILRRTSYCGNPFREMHVQELIKFFYGRDICICPTCKGRLVPYGRGLPGYSIPFLLYDLKTALK